MKILVVDDEPAVCEILSLYLEEQGHEVITAGNGREGLERFGKETCDLVVTDRMMPEMNGDQMATAIKELNPKMPIILVTGFADLNRDGAASPPPFDCVVRKPFTRDTLRAATGLVFGSNDQRAA